ncbi:MAG: DUF2970 domain-containing protein, partial [Nevskiales bacterium]|nr:DUF2970 domain-containing protein [Nevskiales bacterium]
KKTRSRLRPEAGFRTSPTTGMTLTPKNSPPSGTPGLKQIAVSVLAAAFGVQSHRNRVRDFTHGKAWHFVVAGLLFTAVLVGILYLAVRLAVTSAT